MRNYSLIPIQVGANIFTDRTPPTYKAIPVYMYYIEGPKDRILIDSGKAPVHHPTLEAMMAKRDPEMIDKTRGSWQAVVDGLAKYDLKPKDIDIIIVTHAHSGHLGFVSEFRNARFVIQRAELDFALNPLPPVRVFFNDKNVKKLAKHPRLEVVDGDVEIVPGVTVLKSPGHTPGLQTVAVETSEGLIVYASDLVHSYHEMYPAHDELGVPRIHTHYLPPPFYISLGDLFKSYDRITAMTRKIIPAHDEHIVEGQRIPPLPFWPKPK